MCIRDRSVVSNVTRVDGVVTACADAINPGATNIEQPRTTAAIFEVIDLIDVGRTRMDEPFAVG